MNKTQDKFSLPAVSLSIFAAAAAERLPVCSSSRALLWQEVLAAVLLMILSALVSRFWQSGPPKSAAWAAAFCLQVWLAVELAGTFWKALQVCREERRGVCLPILTALVQTAATLGMALVFGRTYPARELLRAWSTGTFSRLDAALLLVWLTCAIFRIGVLCTAVRMLGQEYAIQKRKEVRQ